MAICDRSLESIHKNPMCANRTTPESSSKKPTTSFQDAGSDISSDKNHRNAAAKQLNAALKNKRQNDVDEDQRPSTTVPSRVVERNLQSATSNPIELHEKSSSVNRMMNAEENNEAGDDESLNDFLEGVEFDSEIDSFDGGPSGEPEPLNENEIYSFRPPNDIVELSNVQNAGGSSLLAKIMADVQCTGLIDGVEYTIQDIQDNATKFTRRYYDGDVLVKREIYISSEADDDDWELVAAYLVNADGVKIEQTYSQRPVSVGDQIEILYQVESISYFGDDADLNLVTERDRLRGIDFFRRNNDAFGGPSSFRVESNDHNSWS